MSSHTEKSENREEEEKHILPKSIRVLQQYAFTRRVEPTAPTMPSDFFIETQDLPGDLLVPGLVFFAIRDVNGTLLAIGRSTKRTPAIKGLTETSEFGTQTSRTIDDIANLTRTIGVHETESEPLTELEVVYSQSPGAKILGSTGCRMIANSPFQIVNVQNHDFRNGVSIYLRDPHTPVDPNVNRKEWRTFADLLEQEQESPDSV